MGAVFGILVIGVIVFFAFKAFNKKSNIVADTSDKPKPPTSDEINDELRNNHNK